MPLYEYRCLDCGREMEVLQKVTDRPKRTCESCKGKLEKMISRTSFQLKGGGWFAHGYTGSGGKSGGGSGSSGSSGSSGDKSGSDSGGKSGGGSSGGSGGSGDKSGSGSSSKPAAST